MAAEQITNAGKHRRDSAGLNTGTTLPYNEDGTVGEDELGVFEKLLPNGVYKSASMLVGGIVSIFKITKFFIRILLSIYNPIYLISI